MTLLNVSMATLAKVRMKEKCLLMEWYELRIADFFSSFENAEKIKLFSMTSSVAFVGVSMYPRGIDF